MCRLKICIIFYSLVLLLKPLCAGSVSENDGELDIDWETKLSLNSSYELGGKVIRSSFPSGFVFGTAGAAYQVCIFHTCCLGLIHRIRLGKGFVIRS